MISSSISCFGQGPTPDGITVASGFNAPTAVYLDAHDTLYVVDQRNHRVQKWAPGATSGTTVAGGNGRGSGANQLNNPWSIDFDAAGNMYISDTSNERVQKWARGATSGVTVAGGNGAGNGLHQLDLPQGIFADSTGTVYVTEFRNNRVTKWLPGATQGIIVAGGNGYGYSASHFYEPTDCFVDKNGDIYVTDSHNDRVQKWAPGATSGITVAGSDWSSGRPSDWLGYPSSIYVDSVGTMYIGCLFDHSVRVRKPGSSVSYAVAGGNYGGNRANQLNYAEDVCLDKLGYLYVADNLNNRVQKFPPTCTQSPTATLSGSQTVSSGQSATLSVALTGSFPWNMTISSGLTYRNILTSPFTFTVAPSMSVSYSINSVTNGCGFGTVAGTAVVSVRCTNMYSSRSGDWTDPSVWTCNRVPSSDDEVVIKATHVISILPGNRVHAKRILFSGGQLNYLTATSQSCIGCP